jgi:TetR/AcrR family transcriptional regulator, cholesterol catabolism regulator
MRKKLILKEAARLFREKGFQACSQRELAKRVGIMGGSLYHHFSSKQDILFQVMENTMDDMIARLAGLLAETVDPEERLRRMLRFHIEFNVYGPDDYGSDEPFITDDALRYLDADNYRQIIAKRDAYKRMFEEVLLAGRQQGWLVADPKLTARAVIQLATGVSRWYQPDGPLSLEQISGQYADLLFCGLLPRKS